ncbi:MAG: ThuA domain-containing protein [Planctomycetes bacterium]|nr:ThuA domain-containing protein [Planctomycetota bacterium]
MRVLLAACCAVLSLSGAPADESVHWLAFEGGEGPGRGKHVVLIAAEDEYRSEEALPMLARILSTRFGYACTVLFAIDPATGLIQPDFQTNIPGTHLLSSADMLVIHARFRHLPDEQMAALIDYTNSGRPILGLRTSTHAFRSERGSTSPFAKWAWDSESPKGGWGQAVLGETWISHHGEHGVQGTRGVLNPVFASHPVIRGCADIFGPSDVYTVEHLGSQDAVLVHGQVLEGLSPSDKPVADAKNDTLQPLVWTREYKGETGKVSRVVCTTMGAAVDFSSAGLRRLCVNAVLWSTGAEGAITAETDVTCIGPYQPSFFGFGKFAPGKRPAEYR